MEVITSKRCTGCGEMWPIEDFRFRADRGRWATMCNGCERKRSLQRYHRNRGPRVLWVPTDSEIAIIRKHYPRGGSRACMPYLPGKRVSQIQRVAANRGIACEVHLSGSPEDGQTQWAVPAHDYCEADIAMRGWRDAMPVAGVFSASLGLVVGVAA